MAKFFLCLFLSLATLSAVSLNSNVDSIKSDSVIGQFYTSDLVFNNRHFILRLPNVIRCVTHYAYDDAGDNIDSYCDYTCLTTDGDTFHVKQVVPLRRKYISTKLSIDSIYNLEQVSKRAYYSLARFVQSKNQLESGSILISGYKFAYTWHPSGHFVLLGIIPEFGEITIYIDGIKSIKQVRAIADAFLIT